VPLTDLLGIAIGHLYLYLQQNKLLSPWPIVKRFYRIKYIRDMYRKYRSEHNAGIGNNEGDEQANPDPDETTTETTTEDEDEAADADTDEN
jgi:hypothetical protein